jgi:hypothetical protein
MISTLLYVVFILHECQPRPVGKPDGTSQPLTAAGVHQAHTALDRGASCDPRHAFADC